MKIVLKDSALFLKGSAFDTIGYTIQLFAIIDTATGEVLRYRTYDHATSYFWFLGDLFEDYKGDMVTFGRIRNDTVGMMTFDYRADTMYYRTYPHVYEGHNDFPPNVGSMGMTLDSGFILTYQSGADSLSAEEDGFAIMRLDKDGNLLWQRVLNLPTRELCYTIKQRSEGGYYAAGILFNPWDNPLEDVFVLQLDTLGNIVRQYVEQDPQKWSLCWKITEGLDGGVVGAGTELTIEYSPVDSKNYPYIFKLDSNLNLEWEQRMGNGGYSQHNHLFDVQPSNEEDGYIVGGQLVLYHTDSFHFVGLLGKVGLDGDSIWMRQISVLPEVFYTGIEMIQAITPTVGKDGYWLSGSVVRNDINVPPKERSQIWIAKVDNHGCLVPGCHLSSPVSYLPDKPVELLIYPNPTADWSYLHTPRVNGVKDYVLHIYDNAGRLVKVSKNLLPDVTYAMDFQGYAKGLYRLVLYDGAGRLLGKGQVLRR